MSLEFSRLLCVGIEIDEFSPVCGSKMSGSSQVINLLIISLPTSFIAINWIDFQAVQIQGKAFCGPLNGRRENPKTLIDRVALSSAEMEGNHDAHLELVTNKC